MISERPSGPQTRSTYGLIGIDLLTPQIADQHVSAPAGKRQRNRATREFGAQPWAGRIARSPSEHI